MNMRRYDVTDEQWEKIKELLPPKKTGRPFKNIRNTFNGILWVMCTGAVGETYRKDMANGTRFTNALLTGRIWVFLKTFLQS